MRSVIKRVGDCGRGGKWDGGKRARSARESETEVTERRRREEKRRGGKSGGAFPARYGFFLKIYSRDVRERATRCRLSSGASRQRIREKSAKSRPKPAVGKYTSGGAGRRSVEIRKIKVDRLERPGCVWLAVAGRVAIATVGKQLSVISVSRVCAANPRAADAWRFY